MTEETRSVEQTAYPRRYKWELLGLLCLAFFFHQGDRAIIGVLATEIEADLQLNKAEIGLIAAILFWTIAVMTPIAGYLGDMLRKKVLITGALLFWSSTTALTGLSRGFFSLAMLRSVATGGGESFYAPPAYALLAKFHQRTRALAMSLHQAALYVGIMTSGFIGGFIAEHWGWRSVFYVYGGAGILVGGLFVFRLKDDRDFASAGGKELPTARPKWENPLRSLSLIFRTPTALLLTIGFTAVVFVNNAYLIFAPGFLEEKFELSEFYAGTYAMFFHHMAALVGVLIGGPLSDALALKVTGGRLRIQTVAMFFGAAAIVYMSLGSTLWAACAGASLYGLFRGLYESNTHASLFEVIEPKYRASAVGALVMAAFLIGAAAPWLMGVLCERGFSMSSVFAGYSLAYVVGGLAVGFGLLVFFKRDRIVEEPRVKETMKITDLKTYVVHCYRTNWVFVKIDTDEGISGVGEATLEMKERAVETAVLELKDYLLGKDPRQIERHFHVMYRDSYWRTGPVLMSALSAVEMALWDISARELGVPVYRLLGGKCNDRVKAYANAWFTGAKTPEAFAENAKAAVARGFRALKWDPFGSAYLNLSTKELDDALAVVGAVRDAVGSAVDLLIEGHGRFNVPTACTIARELEPFRPLFFEEPVPPGNLDALADVRAKSRISIAAGERLYHRCQFRELFERRAADVIQPDVSHAGGLSECKKIAAMAEAYQLPFAPHNPSGPIAHAATMQLAACTPNFYLLETMATDIPWRKDLTTESLVFKDGYFEIPDRPGLGLELNEEAFADHPYQPRPLRHYRGDLTDIRPPEAVPYF